MKKLLTLLMITISIASNAQFVDTTFQEAYFKSDVEIKGNTTLIERGIIFPGGGYQHTAYDTTTEYYNNTTPVPYDVGNISSGTTFSDITLQEVLTKLLYTEVPPGASMTLSQEIGGELYGTIREYGDSNLAIVINWTATRGSENITSIGITNVNCDITPTGATQSGTCNDTLVQDAAESYTMTVIGDEKSGTANLSISWRYANYYGAISQDTATFYTALRGGDQPSNYLNKHLKTNKSEDHDYDCSGGKYIYVLYPASCGDPATVKNGVNDFSDYTITDITITDDWGVSRSYKAFSVNSIQTGIAVNINIVN